MSLIQNLIGTVVGDQVVTQIAKATGMSPEQTKKAVAMAMPLLMGAMAKNSSTEQGAESLNNALDKTQIAEQAIAKETGADSSQIANIMKIAGPLLMGAVGKEKKNQGLDLAGLTGLLSNEKQNMKSDSSIQNMIFDFIDQNDDGSIIDDVIGFASKMLQNNKK